MKKFTGILLAAVLALTIGVFAACGGDDSKNSPFPDQQIRISGSTSVGPLMEKLIGKYIELSGVGSKQFVLSQTGSGSGITNATENTIDFAMSSRALKDTETGIKSFTLAMDGIAIIVNTGNTDTTNMTKDEIKTLYSSKPDVQDPLQTVSREGGSGTRGAFEEIIGLKDALDTQFSQIISSTGAVITAVAGNVKNIGYISLGSLNDSVKAIKVDGVEATAANIKNNTYTISRPFLIVYNNEKVLSAFEKDFETFLKSSQAQAIIEAEGYISVVENAPAYTKPKAA